MLASLLLLALLPTEPRVGSLEPAGGQRGTTVTVLLRGDRLDTAEQVLLLQPGLEVQSVRARAADRCEVTLHIPADCAPGAHALRLVTQHGLANQLWFFVGDLPCLPEAKASEAPVPLPCTIDGTIGGDEVDRYTVELVAGQGCLFEVEAFRLGQRSLDTVLQLHDPAGELLATSDDTALGYKDPWLWHVATSSGRHTVSVRTAVPGDATRGVYRLHLGALPRPVGALPCGGPAGSTLQLQLLGPGLDDCTATVALPNEAGPFAWLPEVAGQRAPTPIWLWVGGASATEAPSRATTPMTKATALALPGSVHGLLAAPGATALHAFRGKRGAAIEFRLLARALRSPLDAVLTVRGNDGRVLASNDDSGGPDSVLRFTPPADGDYQLEVADLLREGSPQHFYRVEAGAPQPQPRLQLTAPRDSEPVLAVPRGGHAGVVLQTINWTPEDLALLDLPPGVTASFGPNIRGAAGIALLLSASTEAGRSACAARFVAAAEPTRALPYTQNLAMLRGRNDVPILQATQQRLPVAVVEPLPFQLAATPPTVPLVQGSRLTLRVQLQRDKGFAGRVRLRGGYAPPGLSIGQLTLDGATTTGELLLEATAALPPGEHCIMLLASSRVGNANAEMALPFVQVQVVAPLISVTAQRLRTTLPASGTTTVELPIELAVTTAPTGPLRAKLLGLPRGVTCQPLELPATATAASLPLSIAADAAVGRHQNLQLELTVPSAHGELLQLHRLAELRLDPASKASAVAKPSGEMR